MATEKPSVKCSIVVPVFNSEQTVGEVIDLTADVCDRAGLVYEIVLVNDGSTDGSWGVLERKAAVNEKVIAVDLLRNYGQHTAVFAGLRLTSGDYVITLDDDLQNPPEEILSILDKAEEGYDVVFGQFRRKRHPLYRRLGTRVVDWIIRRVFGKPKSLVLTSFSCMRREVVDRMCEYQGSYPYIQGLALLHSRSTANTMVEHHPRVLGSSGYNPRKIFELVFRILFNYSSFPLRFVSALGLLGTGVAFSMTAFVLIQALVAGTPVPGWASVAVMLSFFNGITLLIISILGEYVIRLLDQSSQAASYYVSATVRSDG